MTLTTFNSILVPIDGSAASLRALDVAVALQDKFDSNIFILCVYRHHSPLEASLSMVRPYDLESPDEALSQYARELVENAKQKVDQAGGTARGFVKSGHPARTIVSFAKENAIDLIVMGGRGAGDDSGYLLGSVSHKVTSLAECACLTV